MRLQSLALVALTIAALGGCTCADSVHQTRFACESTSECLDGYVCRGGECRLDDLPSGLCFPGETQPCSPESCQRSCGEDAGWQSCAPASGPGFETNPEHCGACGRQCATRLGGALQCIGARCTCVLDEDCPSGDLCGPGGVCVMDTDPCATTACAAGTVCREGACAAVSCAQRCKVGEVCDPGSDLCRPIRACLFAVPCPDGGVCEGGPRPDGEACDDDQGCTFGDQCAAGACQGTAYSCPAPTQCQQSVACAGDGGCAVVPLLDGTGCDDGVACTAGDSCVSGVCNGSPYTCSPDQCAATSVCAGDGGCLTTPRNVGAACDDGQPCSFGDVCTAAGSCAGTPYSCPGVSQCKEAGLCLGDGGCGVVNKAEGTGCDDGLDCTSGDRCASGACVGTALTSYQDLDGDGRGALGATQMVCPLGAGYVLDGGDCDEGNANVQNTLPAALDADRDGVTATTTLDPQACVGAASTFGGRTYYRGADGGSPWLGAASATADCNDNDGDVFVSRASVLLDADRDGYTTGTAVTTCVGASSTLNGRTYYANVSGAFVYLDSSAALGSSDCNDADADVFTSRSVARDADGDGFTTTTTLSAQCTGAASVVGMRTYYADTGGAFSWLPTASSTADCNDASATVGAAVNYYVDGDGDTYGAGAPTARCAPVGGEVLNNTDCNDLDADVHTTRSVALDADNDGLTTTSTTSSQCTGDASAPINGRTYYRNTAAAFAWLATASTVTDCNDANATVLGPTSYYPDVDGDSFGSSAAAPTSRCAPVGQEVTNNSDCNDATNTEYRLVNVALDTDQDGYATAAASSVCVGASATVNGRTYYFESTVGANAYVLGTQLLGTTDCAPTNGALVAPQNNVLQDNDRDGYPFPDDTSVNVSCVGPLVTASGRNYYANGTGGWWLDRTQCIGRAGNNCPTIDCLDTDADVYQSQSVVRDQDRDGFTASSTLSSQCVGAASTFSGRTYYADTSNVGTWSAGASPSIDCYDTNASAFPGQTTYFALQRGDGSFDYDCSGTITANTASSYCSGTAPSTQTYTDGTCATTAAVVTRCTPAALALPAACGRPLAGGAVFILDALPSCVTATQASATLVGCR